MFGQQLRLDDLGPRPRTTSAVEHASAGTLRRPVPQRPQLQSLAVPAQRGPADSSDEREDLAELDWSWSFRGPVLSVLSEDPALLMGSTLAEARVALAQASPEDDATRATDYGARLELPTISWALRVRRHNYLRAFGDQVVLRSSTQSHHPSEAQKLLTHADTAERYLYAWATPDETAFAQWVALDLSRLRRVWADPDRRQLLAAHEVPLRGASRGLALPIPALIANKVVVRAVLARPSFTSLAEAEAFLAGCRALHEQTAAQRQAVAHYLLRHALSTRLYVGPDPL
jgi:hypothetical protein